MVSFKKKYVPKSLTNKDKEKQKKELEKSKTLYKKKKFHTRKKIKSFKSKKSGHVLKASKLYNIEKISASKTLSNKTGCSITGLKEIIKKGQGAYFSSGSRPNQTSQSWAIARLASSITGGKSSVVDYHILEKYCSKNSKALKLAKKQKGGKSIIDCCKSNSKHKKCKRKDGKEFKLPRKFTKKKCRTIKGFSMKSSCAPFIGCK